MNCRFAINKVEELAASIAQVGLLFPPLLVSAEWLQEPGRYFLVHGHRRVAALRHLKYESALFLIAEGLTLKEQYLINLAENGREDLTPAELADRCSTLLEQSKPEITTKLLAERTGYSVSHIQNLVRLRRKLHPDLWKVMIRTGHKAPIRQLLQVVAQPPDEQLARWRKTPGTRTGSSDPDERSVPRLTLNERAVLLIRKASPHNSEEFMRGAKWLSKRLASRLPEPEPDPDPEMESPPAVARPRGARSAPRGVESSLAVKAPPARERSQRGKTR